MGGGGWATSNYPCKVLNPNPIPYTPHPPQEPGASRRVLDYTQFMNSRFLFHRLRKDKEWYGAHQPGGWVGGWVGWWVVGWLGGWVGGWVGGCPPHLHLCFPLPVTSERLLTCS